MKLEKQVCSLELATRLKELGVKQELFTFCDEENVLLYRTSYAKNKTWVLGEMLPKVENIVMMFFENDRCQIAVQGDVQIEIGDKTVSSWGAASRRFGSKSSVLFFIENRQLDVEQY